MHRYIIRYVHALNLCSYLNPDYLTNVIIRVLFFNLPKHCEFILEQQRLIFTTRIHIMSTMITLTIEQVPFYLSGSDFHSSLCAEDKGEFSIPSEFFKHSPDLVTIPSDLSLLLHTMRFWGVKEFPRELIEFLIKKPPSAKVRDLVYTVLAQFDSDFKLLDMYKEFVTSSALNARLEVAARSGRVDILEYLVTSKKQVSGATVRMAAEYGLEDLLKRLTAQLQSSNKNPYSQVSMRMVARNGHAECLRFL